MENVYKAARNITGVSVVPATRINTYEVLGHKTVVFMQEAIDAMEKTFVKGAVKEK
ncbi:MAG: 50S ribosomal protein L4 [Candidatus Levyibacteriota bacterium]